MVKRINKAFVMAAILLLVAVEAYKVCRPYIRISRETKAEVEEENKIDACESTEDAAEEKSVSPEEPETVLAQSREECKKPLEDVTEAATKWRVYESMNELNEAWDLPYVDEATFEWIQAAYAEVDFFGEFENGNPDTYEEYQEIFRKLIRNEVPYVDQETGEKVYIKDSMLHGSEKMKLEDFEYRFFDIDGDGTQELYLYELGGWDCFFKYNPEEKEIFLWYPCLWGPWHVLIGTGKIQCMGLDQYFSYYQYDENGTEICNTYFFFNVYNGENILCVARMPEYAGQEGEIVPEEMKTQGAFERSQGKWYFRITEEQFDKLLQPYREAYKASMEKEKEVTYTYEEFMGLSTP